MTTLNILCAGAVQGLVKSLRADFEREAGVSLHAHFGAVGAMQEALRAGVQCDVMIVTDAMVVALQASGELDSGTRVPLGCVRTGIAVPSGQPKPDIRNADALKESLLSASAVYFPDPQRATAGKHFASVLERLGIREALARRVRNFPSGAITMRELAADSALGAIGCTQITEIKYTPGIQLVGALPDVFELATVYAAALGARSARPALAQRFIDLLGGPATRVLRADGGFEFE